jgi:hypothetical protein
MAQAFAGWQCDRTAAAASGAHTSGAPAQQSRASQDISSAIRSNRAE